MNKIYTKDDFRNEIKNCTCNGKCSRCGECCTPLLSITIEEYKKIKKYIKENNIKSSKLLRNNNYYVRCCFYDFKEKKCKIYDVRPEVCKSFMCSSSYQKLGENREYYDKRAEINGNHIDRTVPMDLLFYGNPTTLLIIANREIGANNEEKMLKILKKLGKDRNFFKKYDIANSYEVAEAIENGNIKLGWED